LVAIVLAAAGLIVAASLPKPVPVDIAEIESAEMIVTVDEDGHARVKDRYVVSAPLTGSLARIELHPGDSVDQGAPLARLVPLASPLLDERTRTTAEARVASTVAAQRQSGAQIKRAEASLEFAKAEAKRQQQLFDKGVITRQELEQVLLAERTASAELDSLRFGARVADYEVKMAQAALGLLSPRKKESDDEQLVIPAPMTGRVLKVLRESEGVVQAGTPLLELGDPLALEIVVDVLTSDAVAIQPGAAAQVDRWGGESLDARVRLVEPSAFTRLSALGVEEQRVNVIIDLVAPQAQWGALGDGYRVEARITVWEQENVVQAPASAVFRHDEGWAVFRVEGTTASLQAVQIGKRNGRAVQIVEGLEPGMTVVIHPSDRVTSGVEIQAR
jgi:HlyD family secretion protein